MQVLLWPISPLDHENNLGLYEQFPNWNITVEEESTDWYVRKVKSIDWLTNTVEYNVPLCFTHQRDCFVQWH